ncbi:MAG: asparagine synthetase B family protein [Caulobacter sp.]
MTGIAGLICPQGVRVDPAIAAAMAAPLARLGPDRQDHWRSGRAFLAHALLATTFEDQSDRQPLTFDGETFLVADARIDGRVALVDDLRAAGRPVAADAPDAALILHAWHAWGEAAPEHLIGDFAFAIWDSRTERLFAARDQFGSVPFYFARTADGLVFGNAVPALLAHPGLDRSINPLAVADYLMFGYSLDPTKGFHRDIDRLPPAHGLIFEAGAVRTRRYWTLPEAGDRETTARSDGEIVEGFGALVEEAVRDRTRAARVATTLSGGMDSTLITAMAMREPATRIEAYSFGSDWLMPDTERHWAWRCAHHLGLPFHSISIEGGYLDPPGGHWRLPPEPRMELKYSAFHMVGDRLAAAGTRVLLMGMGGDSVVAGGPHHWAGLMRRGAYGRLYGEALTFWRHHRRRPPLRTAWLHGRQAAVGPITAPLDPDFVREHRLQERWREGHSAFARDPRENMALHPFWTEMFVASHPESTGLPVRVRQPFFDVRLLEASMRMPPSPWQFGKAILRTIGEGLLPDDIVRRPKTVFGANPGWEAARRGLEPWLADLPNAVELEGYVDRKQLATIVGDIGSLPPQDYSRAVVLPAGLAAWLRRRR